MSTIKRTAIESFRNSKDELVEVFPITAFVCFMGNVFGLGLVK
jgi:hypothetical protein